MTNPAAAAERLRQKAYGGDDLRGVFLDDLVEVCRAYLSEHLPDDGEAIDEAWLVSIGWQKGGLCMWLGEYITWSARRGIFVGMYPQPHVTTRGQLRLLLRALGIAGEGE